MAKNIRNSKRGKSKIIDLEATPSDETVDAAAESAEKLEDMTSEQVDVGVDETLQETDTTATQIPAKKTSAVTIAGMVGSAIIGGGVALGGAGALNQMGMLKYVPFASGLIYGGDKQANESETSSELEAKIATLTSQVEKLAKSNQDVGVVGVPTKFAARVDAIEAKLNSPETSNIGGEQLAAMSSKIDIASDKARIAVARADDALAKISEVGQKVISGSGGADEAIIKAVLANETSKLSTKIAELETKLLEVSSNKDAPVADPKITTELSGLGSQLADMSAKVDEVSKQTARLDALEQTLAATNSKIENDIMAPMADVQEAATAALAGQQVARSVSARALSTAIEQGGSFTGELSAAEALVGENDIITQLKPFAKSGVSTPLQLSKSFVPVIDSISSAQSAPDKDAGIFAKFVNNAKSIVKVRPAGPQTGDDGVAIASRIADSLANGDLPLAKGEWETLPEGAKALSTDWVKTLNDRIKAQDLVTQLISVLSSESKG